MILRTELAPGQRLVEAPLAEQLGMSRTPLRQALPLLAQEGLLTTCGKRGYIVRAFTAAEILDAIDVRALLEGYAVRRVAERGPSKALLRRLRSCLEDGDAILGKRRVEASDEGLYADMNRCFHSLVLEGSESTLLTELIERNNRIPFAAPQALAFQNESLEATYDKLCYAHMQHHAIFDALERGQSARAEALMREHAHFVKESIDVSGIPLATGRTPGRFQFMSAAAAAE